MRGTGCHALASGATRAASNSHSSSSRLFSSEAVSPGELKQVILILRHGDRSQITRFLGKYWHDSPELAKAWLAKMPSEKTKHLMRNAACTAADRRTHFDPASLYSGNDLKNFPFGQLTELGARQMMDLGRTLREHYLPRLPPWDAKSMYIRSTNSCRTLQSARCFLFTFLEQAALRPRMRAQDKDAPFIHAIESESEESMFLKPDLAPPSLDKRKQVLLEKKGLAMQARGYLSMHAKLQRLVGCADVPWARLREGLHAHLVHGLPFSPCLTAEDLAAIEDIVCTMWNIHYCDPVVNRLAIGRFVHDVLQDVGVHARQRVLVYSGHDSTLVPLLCALDVYDKTFPPYASYLAIEMAETGRGQCVARVVFNGRALLDWMDWPLLHARLQAKAVTPGDFHKLRRQAVPTFV